MELKPNLSKALQSMQDRMHNQITDGCSVLLQEMNKNLVTLVNLTVTNVEALEESLREDIILIEKQIYVEMNGRENTKCKNVSTEKTEPGKRTSGMVDDWKKIEELAKDKLKEIYKEMEPKDDKESGERLNDNGENKHHVKLVPKDQIKVLTNVVEHVPEKEQHVKKRGRRRNSSNDGPNDVLHPPSPKIRRKGNGNSPNMLYSELPQAQQYNSMPTISVTEISRQEKDATLTSFSLGMSEARSRQKSRKPRIQIERIEDVGGDFYSDNWECSNCSSSNGSNDTHCTECSSSGSSSDDILKRSPVALLEAIIRLASIGKSNEHT